MTTSKAQAARHLWKDVEARSEVKLERPVRSCSAFSIPSSTLKYSFTPCTTANPPLGTCLNRHFTYVPSQLFCRTRKAHEKNNWANQRYYSPQHVNDKMKVYKGDFLIRLQNPKPVNPSYQTTQRHGECTLSTETCQARDLARLRGCKTPELSGPTHREGIAKRS